MNAPLPNGGATVVPEDRQETVAVKECKGDGSGWTGSHYWTWKTIGGKLFAGRQCLRCGEVKDAP